MNILGKIFGQQPSASPDSVTFDASRYSFQGDRNGTRVWYLPEGGGVGLYFFARKPNLPERAKHVAELKDFYTAMSGGKLQVVECRVLSLVGVQSIWLINKGPIEGQAHGLVYLGSLTIPFRDFSFVIKIQCQEEGTTGMREAVLVDEAFRKGTGRIEGDRLVLDGWSLDDEQFDDRFPQHPLSRIRRELRHIASSLSIDPKLKNAARFELPAN